MESNFEFDFFLLKKSMHWLGPRSIIGLNKKKISLRKIRKKSLLISTLFL